MTIIDLITPAEYAILHETARDALAARETGARDTGVLHTPLTDDEEEEDDQPWD